MSDHHEGMAAAGAGEGAGDPIADLLGSAGPRAPMPAAVFERLHRQSREVWLEKVDQVGAVRRRKQMLRRLAVAALVVTALGLGAMLRWPEGSTEPGAELAMGARIAGVATIVVVRGVGGSSAIEAGRTLAAGEALETGDGERLAMALASGATVRLDHQSRLRLASARELELSRGAVYIDAGPAAKRVVVRTPFGVARDIGTRFEVRVLENGLRLQVREGAVDFEQAGEQYRAEAGEVMLVEQGRVQRETIEADDRAWAWVLDAATPFALEGATLDRFLDWVADETGWQVAYADAALEAQARAIITHGSLDGVRPDTAPALVLPGSNLDFRLQDGVLKVLRNAPAPAR